MAKHNKPNHTKETVEVKKDSKGNAEVVETTKKEVAKNFDAEKKQIKAEEAILEKEEKQLENIEQTAHKAKEETEKLIAQKEAQLVAMEAAPVVTTTKEVTIKEEVPAKSESKWVKNPISVIRNLVTTSASGILGFPSRVVAKAAHIASRPQQLVSKQFYKDLFTNIVRAPGAMITGITGSVYKPHRDKFTMVDTYKDYGPEFANPTDKSGIVRGAKKAIWLGGKVVAPTMTAGTVGLFPKFFSNIWRGTNHFFHETLEGVKNSKFSLNPKKWGFKYSKTKEAFSKAFSWNKKGVKPAGKTVELTTHKKAA